MSFWAVILQVGPRPTTWCHLRRVHSSSNVGNKCHLSGFFLEHLHHNILALSIHQHVSRNNIQKTQGQRETNPNKSRNNQRFKRSLNAQKAGMPEKDINTFVPTSPLETITCKSSYLPRGGRLGIGVILVKKRRVKAGIQLTQTTQHPTFSSNEPKQHLEVTTG